MLGGVKGLRERGRWVRGRHGVWRGRQKLGGGKEIGEGGRWVRRMKIRFQRECRGYEVYAAGYEEVRGLGEEVGRLREGGR